MKTQPIITNLENGFRFIDWPAFTYMESTNSEETPVTIDKGGRHLGEMVPGVAVALPTRRGDMIHKHFGICEDDDGNPLAYGKGVSLTAEKRAKEFLAAAQLDQIVIYKGQRYAIRRAANDNITLEKVEG